MSVTLIKGDDPTLVSQALQGLVAELGGAGDRSLMVEEVGEAQYAPDGAEAELTPRLAAEGWELLNVVGVFDDAGLDERRANAGDNYLRY